MGKPLLSSAGLTAAFHTLLLKEASFDPEDFCDGIHLLSSLGVPL